MRVLAQAFLVALAAVLAGCASNSIEDLSKVQPPPAVPIRDTKIIPGQRVGPVSLGMSETELYRTMGEPRKTNTFSWGTSYEFEGLYATVYNSTHRVHIVGPISHSYSTPEGIHLGSSELAARAAYKNGKWVADEYGFGVGYCDPRGMKISTIQGAVGTIQVWSPGCK